MTKYILKRVATSLVTLFLITFMLFVLVRVMPGNPFPSERMSAEQIASKRAEMGLDDPVLMQFFRYIGGVLHGDFGKGTSPYFGAPIKTVIATCAYNSFSIGGIAILEGTAGVLLLGILAVLAIFMPKGMGLVIVALLLTEWIPMSKIARAEMLKLKEQEYVLASRTLGAKSMHIIFRQILPNTIGPIITQMMFSIPLAIFTEAFLRFVGVGIMLPQCSVGSLISTGFNNISTLPYQILSPILVLALQMLGFNFIGDGLREALAPRLEDM